MSRTASDRSEQRIGEFRGDDVVDRAGAGWGRKVGVDGGHNSRAMPKNVAYTRQMVDQSTPADELKRRLEIAEDALKRQQHLITKLALMGVDITLAAAELVELRGRHQDLLRVRSCADRGYDISLDGRALSVSPRDLGRSKVIVDQTR